MRTPMLILLAITGAVMGFAIAHFSPGPAKQRAMEAACLADGQKPYECYALTHGR